MIVSIDGRKNIWQIQHPVMIKTLKTRKRGTSSTWWWASTKKPYTAVNDERLNTFPCDDEQGKVSAVTTVTQHTAGSSTQCSKARKGNKKHSDSVKEKIKLSLTCRWQVKIHI